ncbi:outer membrane lipoprotein chaperone LolA [Halothiobacillus sp. DCM-1]|uniref:outer membrane lipoprotein chaperone LolA n=1 Tax=Halothiobacillus sp. DCM-1 TaxID=3112558 RepID=UPI0032430696
MAQRSRVGLAAVCFGMAWLALSPVASATTEATPLLSAEQRAEVSRLTDFVHALKTFSADFIQQQVNARGQKQPASTGSFVLARPGKFYWEYQSPYVQKLIARDGTLWVYDPDLKQVTINDLSQDRGAPIGIFLGGRPLEAAFLITPQGANDGLSWFSLTERNPSGDFTQLQVGMDTRGIKAMVFTDKLGNRTTVQFSERKINQPVDASRFDFTPPAGVDVVKNSAP